MVKRIVNGVAYNTATSTRIAGKNLNADKDDLGRWYETSITLYQTTKGALFIDYQYVTQIPSTSPHEKDDRREEHEFVPMTAEEARAWVLEKDKDTEIFDDTFAAKIPEAEAEAGATIYVRVPAALKRRIDEAARTAEQSASTWGLKCFENCLRDPHGRAA
jgi:predicted HicB family RNase H-like nuclease